ncbi:MAG: hypothetical protein DMF69_02985 [Acidobacteria bacterium]|nr:MAG: hypothetical protein DMF69_02985 [Acidobacteriota bacterium]
MPLHAKYNLTYLPYCLIPLLLLAVLNYWNGLRTVDSTLSFQAQHDLNSLSGEIDRRLQNEQSNLRRAAYSTPLRERLGVRRVDPKAEFPGAQDPGEDFSTKGVSDSLTDLLRGFGRFQRLAVFDLKSVSVFQLKVTDQLYRIDPPVVVLNGGPVTPPQITIGKESVVELRGSTLRCSVPVTAIQNTDVVGSLVGELDLTEVIAEAARVLGANENSSTSQRSFVAAIDSSARFVYHPTQALNNKVVSSALPEFLPIAEALSRNQSGMQTFVAANNQMFITAFSPLPQWNFGLAVGYDRSQYTQRAHSWGIIGLTLALAGGLTGALLLSHHVQKKSHGIERVEEGLTAIAKGELDRRIELKSSDDARVIADSINLMTEKMRAQIAREEESRQFQTFARLSAMLTHDLKNSIEALSLIVGNMEQHFDNADFRVDAMKSLTSATDKLKALVARLSRPLTSLSGEHPRPKSVDLIPIIKRVAAKTAEPLRSKHTIETNLPRHLFAYVDPDRIENVIENLILNAIEAMAEQNGKLSIDAGVTTRGAAMFSISDTGPGLSKEFIQSRLFKPFSTTKRNGVGLGLYTCREIVEASAGLIEVESSEGAGTTFRVVLPSASHDSRN